MFKEGDLIIYGSNGVCKVEKVGTLNSDGVPKDKIYYTLTPCYANGTKIFTPADNQKVVIRPLISQKDALRMIDGMEEIESLWITDEKKRENTYKEAYRTCDCIQWIRIIKTIYTQQQTRIAEGKKLTARDEKYFNMAEESLYGELAAAFGIEKDEAKAFVIARAKQSAAEKKEPAFA